VNQRVAPASRRSARNIRPEPANLAALGDRNLLFNEAHQAVYELNDLAAYVWRSLDTGMGEGAIVRELIETGLDPDQAGSAVLATLQELRTLHTATRAPPPLLLPKATERLTRLAIHIAGVAVQLHLSRALVADVEAVFGPLITDLHDTDMLLCARVAGSTVNVFSPGQPDWSCDRSHFIPLLKAQLIESVLLCAAYEVAMHAAALTRGDDAVLLVGSPGAGKTTLAIALEKAGFQMLADDVVLLHETGRITGVPLPFAAKASSWLLLSQHWPGIAATPSHSRPDGQTLCYIPQDPIADPRSRRIGSVVLLNRQDAARTSIQELDLVCALSALFADGATRDQRLSMSGFTALVDGLRDARCCQLTYSDLIEAADAVCGFHR